MYDPVYGSKANAILAEIKLKKYSSHFIQNLKVYLSGESFDEALKLCEEALTDMPDNTELLFSAAYASCMLGKKEKADTYAELYALQTANSPLSAELKTLISAWFTESFDDDIAIEKFLSLKSKSLLTPAVKRRIKSLLISSHSFEKYEQFIRKEIDLPGSDRDSLERELISFLLEQHQFKKALELLNRRPIESLEDNLLYIWALCETNEDLKALNMAKSLISVAPRDLRVYKAWIKAWISYTEKNNKVPEGIDETGTPYKTTMEKIFKLLRPDKLITQEPELLLYMFRMAILAGKEVETHKLNLEIAKISFKSEYEKLLIDICDDLITFNKDWMAIILLENASSQLPNNYNLVLKSAQISMLRNPNTAIQICEDLIDQQPDLIRAYILWSDAMNLAGRGGEAITVLVKKLSDKSLNDYARRELNAKLEELRIQGNTDAPYVRTVKVDEDKTKKDKQEDDDDQKLDGEESTEGEQGDDTNQEVDEEKGVEGEQNGDSEQEDYGDQVDDGEVDNIDSQEDVSSDEDYSEDVDSNNSDINNYSPPSGEDNYENLDGYEDFNG